MQRDKQKDKSNISRKILSDITVYSKYARYLPNEERRETWEEIVLRNVSMHATKFPKLQDEIYNVYGSVLDKKVLPSMRSLQFGGKPIEISPNRLFNCFSRETEFITNQGTKSFQDYNDGDDVVVPTHLNTFRKAKVRKYGKQKLNKIVLHRGRSSKTVFATPEHRWLKFDGTETTDLAVKDIIYPAQMYDSQFDYDTAGPMEKLYWCYGYVYGDGTLVKSGDKTYSMVRLCGDDVKYLPRFKEMGFSSSEPNSCKGDIFVYTGKYQKSAPDLSTEKIHMIRAFMDGYLSADAYKNPDWYSNQYLSKYISIQASDEDHINFLRKGLELCGYFITNVQDLTGQETNFGVRPETYKFSITTRIGSRENTAWVVHSIDETERFEDVWCLEVEDHHSFILSGGIVTGNCAYMPIDDVAAFSETMFLLLGGTGVGYSVQKHHVEKLPEVIGPKKRRRRYLIGDSIEGWADAIKVLVESYFYNKSIPDFDYRDIRPKGANLITSGGKAPGPQPLKDCIHNVRKVFDAALEARGSGTQINTLEVHDIICYIADAVLAGGIRRAALISLFSFDDQDMLTCKFGNWWELNPQRARANNSAVALRHRIKKKHFFEFWEKVKASGSGEPGIYFTNDKEWGANPSLRRGTKVITSTGIYPIEKLQDSDFNVINLNEQWSSATCRLSGRNKRLYKLTLQGGHRYYATKEHKWPTIDINTLETTKYNTSDLKSGQFLPIVRRDTLFESKVGNYDDGFFFGWLYGDGWFNKKNNSLGLIVSKADGDNIRNKLESYLRNVGCNAAFKYKGSTMELSTTSKTLMKHLTCFGIESKDILPSSLWTCSEEMRRGFIDGIFSSDGHVEKNDKRVCLTNKYKSIISDISELLGFYGIMTSIKNKTTKLYDRTYKSYILTIGSNNSIRHFRKLFSLSHQDKHDRLSRYEFNRNDGDYIKILSVEETDLYEDVWDIGVRDVTHCFQIAHCITGNCVEIALRPCQFCNLTTVNVSDVTSQEDLNSRVRAAAFIGTLQASYTDFHYLRDTWQKTTEKEALIGVSMTGIASGSVLKFDLQEAANVVKEENIRVAKLIGIQPAARTTCIKPEGCQKKETIVSTKEGILSLEEIGDIESDKIWQDHDFKVYTDNGEKPSTKFFKNGLAKTKKILTDGGIELESTHNHMYRVLTEEGSYEWKRADELEEGMMLPYSVGEYDGGSIQHLRQVTPIHSNQKIIRQPSNLSNDLAWFLGLYFGDGSNHKKGIRIHGNFNEQKGFDKLKEVVNDVFDLPTKIHRHTANDGRCSVYINSTMLLSYLGANGLLKEKSDRINIPEIIRRSPKDIIESFIEGYATADGCNKSDTRSFCTTSKTMAEQLVVVLRAIGKDCKMRLMPPTESSFGSNMRYWIQERKGRLANPLKIRKYMMDAYCDLSEKGLHHLSIDTIVSLSDGECETYDIEVNDEKHTYLANSYVSHNTASLVVGTSSGIHAWHAPYYIRRMRLGKNEPIYNYLKRAIPELLEDEMMKPDLESVLSVPVKAPKDAIFRDESAMDLLERGRKFSIEWVKGGHLEGSNRHNVSITVSIKEHEWDTVGNWMWENRSDYNGISVLPHDGGSYIQAPFEDCSEEMYDTMLERCRNIDLTKVKEHEDNTQLKENVACSGGACEVTAVGA